MALRGGPVLGLEFGEGQVRAVAARRAGRGYAAAAWAERPTPAGGPLAPPGELGPLLRELAAEVKAGTNRVVIALSSQHILVRRVVLPRLRPARLRRMLEEEGMNYIPFLSEGAAFDLRLLDGPVRGRRRAEAGHRAAALLAAVPSRVVSALQESCQAAGLVLAGLELDLLSAFRGLQAAESRQPTALVHVGDRRARVAIFHGGQPVVARSLEVTGDGLPELSSGVRRLLELTLEAGGPPLELLCLSGPTAGGNLAGALAEVLPAELAGLLHPEFRIEPLMVPAESPGAEQAAAAFGAALAPVAPPGLLDLLPRPTFQQVAARRRRLVYGLLGLALIGLYGWWWSVAVPAGRSQLAALLGEEKSQQQRLARAQSVKELEQQAASLATVVRDMALVEAPLSEAYTGLKALFPGDTELAEVGGSLPNQRIAGTARRPELVDDLVVRLAQSPLVTEVSLKTLHQAEDEYRFELMIQLKGKEVGAIGTAQPPATPQD